MSLIVGVLAITAAFANPIGVYRMRRIMPYINRISGALVMLVGLYVSYYGVYEVRVFSADPNPNDPVIAAAVLVQGTLASWAHRDGAYPWLLALAMLVLGAIALALHRRPRGSAFDPEDDKFGAGVAGCEAVGPEYPHARGPLA
jgi:hypothetical protein